MFTTNDLRHFLEGLAILFSIGYWGYTPRPLCGNVRKQCRFQAAQALGGRCDHTDYRPPN